MTQYLDRLWHHPIREAFIMNILQVFLPKKGVQS